LKCRSSPRPASSPSSTTATNGKNYGHAEHPAHRGQQGLTDQESVALRHTCEVMSRQSATSTPRTSVMKMARTRKKALQHRCMDQSKDLDSWISQPWPSPQEGKHTHIDSQSTSSYTNHSACAAQMRQGGNAYDVASPLAQFCAGPLKLSIKTRNSPDLVRGTSASC
jgi:predicted GIY-YIG superfamily endonuclease